MSILSTLNKLTGKNDKNVLAALNSLTGKTADDIEEAMGNLGGGGGESVPMTKVVLLKGPYDEEVSPLFPSTLNVGIVEYVYGDSLNKVWVEFSQTDKFSDLYGGPVLAGEVPAGSLIPCASGGGSSIRLGENRQHYELSTSQMYPGVVSSFGALILASEPEGHIPLFVEEFEGDL